MRVGIYAATAARTSYIVSGYAGTYACGYAIDALHRARRCVISTPSVGGYFLSTLLYVYFTFGCLL